MLLVIFALLLSGSMALLPHSTYETGLPKRAALKKASQQN
jgi:hypothetical protein